MEAIIKHYFQFEADLKSKMSSIFTNSENMRELEQNVPQYEESRIQYPEIPFFPALLDSEHVKEHRF